MENILIIEDNEDVNLMLSKAIKNAGYNVKSSFTGIDGLNEIKTNSYDLVLLDIMLPYKSGDQILKEVRQFSSIPIIIISAKDMISTKIDLLKLGADDYITKPFMPKELVFRLNAVLRRCYKEDSPLIELHDCKIDLANAQVIKNDEVLPLTAKEHDILETLVRNANHIVTIDALCEAVWGDNPFGYGNSLLAHIRRIREKIELNPSKPKSLITVKGLGYKINVESRLQ